MAWKSWFNIIRNSADAATIDIFDEIGYWGITAKQFVTDLRALGEVKELTLNIDCPGGDCNDGFSIYDAIRASKAHVTANITGVAASMASVIMLAAKTIRIAENGRVMLHRVTGAAMGNADELDAAARTTRQFEDRIVQLYMARSKGDEVTIRDFMKADAGTWFFGQEAVDHGFADEVMSGLQARAFQQRWAGMFTMLPSALFDTANPPPVKPPITPPPQTMTEAEMKAAVARAEADKAEAEKKLKEAEAAKAATEKSAADAKAQADKQLAAEQAKTAAAEKAAADAKAAAAAENKSLGDRLKKIEDMAASGVLGASKGAPPVTEPGSGGGETKNLSSLQLIASARTKAA